MTANINLKQLTKNIINCRICQDVLPHGINPVFQVSSQAKVLIAGQAPGIKVHESGIAFNDKSGERLREWLGVTTDEFYNKELFAILPMAFCYPGKGKSGDLPPRKECAKNWRNQLLSSLPNIELIVAIGSYAQDWHLSDKRQKTLTDTVKNWQYYFNTSTPKILPIPHPSPRNNIWLKKNAWFEEEVVQYLQKYVRKTLISVANK